MRMGPLHRIPSFYRQRNSRDSVGMDSMDVMSRLESMDVKGPFYLQRMMLSCKDSFAESLPRHETAKY